MQKHICFARRGVVGNEEQEVAGRRNGNIAARAGAIRELRTKGGASGVAGENAELFATCSRIGIDDERAEICRKKAGDIEPYNFSSAGVDLGVVIDIVAVAPVTETDANSHLVSAAIVAYQLTTRGKHVAGYRRPAARLGV